MSTKSIKDIAPKFDITLLEQKIHNLTNKQRVAYGHRGLIFDSSLILIARKHSVDMAKNNFFSHDNFNGEGPTERGKNAGFSCRKKCGNYYINGLAENIFQNNLFESVSYFNGVPHYHWKTIDEIVRSTVKGWMKSSGHRKNILTSMYESEGIGVAIAENGKIYITQDFF
jgi:uncharacterized protein YkwD